MIGGIVLGRQQLLFATVGGAKYNSENEPGFLVSVSARAVKSAGLTVATALRGWRTHAQGRVRHAGAFPELEDELCGFGPDGTANGRSPDRLDALVWAITALMLGPVSRPAIRRMRPRGSAR